METPPNAGPPQRLILGLLIALVCVGAVALWRGGPATGESPAEPAASGGGEVTLARRTPEGESSPVTVAIDAGATVLDATRAAGRDHGGVWASAWRGDGADAFLTSLGGEGSRPQERLFWLFEVNDAESEVGAGVATLRPGDRVLWKLAAYE
ncbi:MAG: DUF4430 domain-containing protein [Planctomycetota bacterium]